LRLLGRRMHPDRSVFDVSCDKRIWTKPLRGRVAVWQ
jgi:hypothetical protein